MSRHESDREDIMAEATALVRRVEFQLNYEPPPIVAGFKRSGHLSIYFDQDPVYHFDENGLLRRAYVGGHLYRTQGETLACLDRDRSASATHLMREDLETAALEKFRIEMLDRLKSIVEAFGGDRLQVLRQLPADDDFVRELVSRIQQLSSSPSWLAPIIRGKR
ncbi:MAG: hypothetical protein CMJ78_24725 [Planctomycetaceae bacterium]|nr:hypothetical protein [Planctomycetaceae bacterium]